MPRKSTVAIDLVRRRLRAVHVSHSRQGLTLRRVHVAIAPNELDMNDHEAVGAWVAVELGKGKIPRRNAVVAMSREHVALKRITLPTTDRYELPDMVRFSMDRDLPFDATEAVIDYVPVAVKENRTTVVAVAIQKSVKESIEAVMRAAGVSIDRISVRCLGTVALLNSLDRQDDQVAGWMAIDVTGDGVEVSVMDEGFLRFSRATDIQHAPTPERFVETVVTETKRSWMSYRIVEDASAIRRAIVFGEEEVAKRVRDSIGDMLGEPTMVMEAHPKITVREDARTAWPLTGLLLEPIIGSEMIDFSNPRRAPDRHARTRQLLLAAAGSIVVLLLGAMLFGQRELQRIDRQIAELQPDRQALVQLNFRREREYFRYEHLNRWEAAHVDWLAHFAHLYPRLPQPERLVLDAWSGSQSYQGVAYDRREDQWSVPREIVITVRGEAVSRELADQFRDTLVETREYTTRSMGPDSAGGRRHAHPFRLSLRSTLSTPPIETEMQEAPGGESDVADTAADEDAGAEDRS